jgi:hypothetical protein
MRYSSAGRPMLAAAAFLRGASRLESQLRAKLPAPTILVESRQFGQIQPARVNCHPQRGVDVHR